MSSSNYISDETDLLTLVPEFAGELKRRAEEFEQQGYVSQDLTDRFAELGLYRLCNPKIYSGLERPPLDYAKIVEALAQYDASTAWCLFIGITSALSVANLSPDAASSILSNPTAITAGVFAPMGRAVACEENGVRGYRLSGQWPWASGSRNASYVSGGGFVLNDSGEIARLQNGAPDQKSFFMPVSDIELLDTWHVSGLKGSGSTDYKVENLFVPESMTFDALRKNTPDSDIHRFPIFGFLAIGIGAVALGIARACLDEFLSLATQKTPQGSSKPLAMKSATQSRVAKAEAKLRAARLYFHDSIENAWQSAQQNQTVSVSQKRDIRLATTFAVQSATEVVDSIYTLAGGTSVYLRSPIQRHFRDIHVVTQHMMVSESSLELTGALFLDIETNTAQL